MFSHQTFHQHLGVPLHRSQYKAIDIEIKRVVIRTRSFQWLSVNLRVLLRLP
jgi:hypothetical protein